MSCSLSTVPGERIRGAPIDHEDRRELRGARLLAAWLNHFDSREQNSMDVFMKVPAVSGQELGYVRHYIMDLGDCFGSTWSSDQLSRRIGHAYYLDFNYLALDFVTFGAVQRPCALAMPALNSLISTLLFKAVARERPLVADCKADPNFDALCTASSYASFPSSHASTAFTAAGLTCVHHAYLPLYGGAWDTAACIESLLLATATALFRVVGDRHYTSDVLAGALMGFAIGYLYPYFFHYRGAAAPRGKPSAARSALPTRLQVLPLPGGVGMTLAF